MTEYYGGTFEGPHSYLVMDFAEGKPLDYLLRAKEVDTYYIQSVCSST